ncbi:unnamed protein product [Lampetra planeri]
MGLRHTIGQRCAERGGAERLTGECVRGAREEELTEERAAHARGACGARERSVRGTREELALHARGDADHLSGPAGFEDEWRS